MNVTSSILFVGSEAEVAHHAAPLARHLPVRVVDAQDVLQQACPGDIVLFFNEYYPRFREVIPPLQERGCATIYAVDGILEWRNSWSFPHDMAVHWVMRPVLCDKVACIGRSQARVLESWGNLGKCEIVGVPRFDGLLQSKSRQRPANEPWTVLVLTAKTPGFTPEQIERTRISLLDLKKWFDEHPELGGLPIRPRWRITGGLDDAIGVANELRDTTGSDLAAALRQVDAVITTPSTTMLEAMLNGLPVALLDYHNCPHYVPAAWTISASRHLDDVLRELTDPPPEKMVYQQSILHDALECHSPATPRLVELVQEMSRITHDCLGRSVPPRFPNRILKDAQNSHHLPEELWDLQRLFPEHAVFSNMDRTLLQTQLGDCQLQVQTLRQEYEALRGRKETLRQQLQLQIESCQSSLSFRLGRAITWPLRTLAEFMR